MPCVNCSFGHTIPGVKKSQTLWSYFHPDIGIPIGFEGGSIDRYNAYQISGKYYCNHVCTANISAFTYNLTGNVGRGLQTI